MRVLFAASECVPFIKTGGLADVVGTLPLALKKQGIDVRIVLPFHAKIKGQYEKACTLLDVFQVALGWRNQYCGILKLERDGLVYYFVDNLYYFGGPIYKGGQELEQYVFFAKAVEALVRRKLFVPDVLHLNDWHVAACAALLSGEVKTLLTIHNLAFQGRIDRHFAQDVLGIDTDNLLALGIERADKISTVSPQYAKEMITEEYFAGMHCLKNRKDSIVGIVNGIDQQEYQPQADTHLCAAYSEEDLRGKAACKRQLIKTLKLAVGEDTPVIGVVSRLTPQKGVELLCGAMDAILKRGAVLAILGSGEQEERIKCAAALHPGRVRVVTDYDEALAHQIYAGADFFLMPSRFEPCGIAQLIAMRYGTPPIVRATGGLKDTVTPYEQGGTGFVFAPYTVQALLEAVEQALSVYEGEKNALLALRRRCMQQDFGWEKASRAYLALYQSLLE